MTLEDLDGVRAGREGHRETGARGAGALHEELPTFGVEPLLECGTGQHLAARLELGDLDEAGLAHRVPGRHPSGERPHAQWSVHGGQAESAPLDVETLQQGRHLGALVLVRCDEEGHGRQFQIAGRPLFSGSNAPATLPGRTTLATRVGAVDRSSR